MADFIQIGVTSLRDPVTGEPLEAVPMYIRREDAGSQERARIQEGPLARDLAAMMREYVQGTEGLPA